MDTNRAPIGRRIANWANRELASHLVQLFALALVAGYAIMEIRSLRADIEAKIDARVAQVDQRLEEYHHAILHFARDQATEVSELSENAGALRDGLVNIVETTGADLAAEDRDSRHRIYERIADFAERQPARR